MNNVMRQMCNPLRVFTLNLFNSRRLILTIILNKQSSVYQTDVIYNLSRWRLCNFHTTFLPHSNSVIWPVIDSLISSLPSRPPLHFPLMLTTCSMRELFCHHSQLLALCLTHTAWRNGILCKAAGVKRILYIGKRAHFVCQWHVSV